MLYVVLKNINGCDVGVNADGTIETDISRADLNDLGAAEEIARQYGGIVVPENRVPKQDRD